jgi:hypothetical protein
MFTPFEPSAGPTGGAGLAAPPLIWSLINPAISFAIMLFFNSFGDSGDTFYVSLAGY